MPPATAGVDVRTTMIVIYAVSGVLVLSVLAVFWWALRVAQSVETARRMRRSRFQVIRGGSTAPVVRHRPRRRAQRRRSRA